MSIPDMDKVLRAAHVTAQSIVVQLNAGAGTTMQRATAVAAIVALAKELLDEAQTLSAALEAELHVESGGEVH